MVYILRARIAIAMTLGLVISSGPSAAAQAVVVIPLAGDEIEIYRGTSKTGNAVCSYYADPPGHYISASSCTDAGVAGAGVSGQDAQFQRGVAVMPRFVVAGGVVRDQVTNLIWLRDGYCAAQRIDWPAALAAVTELNTLGTMKSQDCGDTSNQGQHQTDWRLPNIKELQTLFDYGFHAGPYLPNTVGNGHWQNGDPFESIRVDAAY